MGKTKTFISTIPFQGKDREGNDLLKPVTYAADGNSRLTYGATRFPVIPMINGYAERGDKIRIIAILTDGDNFRHNYVTYFEPEISELVEKNGYEFGEIEVVTTPDQEDIDTQLVLFADIIAKINDEEVIFACITFGTKPTPIVQTMALNYAHKLKKGTTIGCVVYGRFRHGAPVGHIFDTTALFYMDSMVNVLAEKKVPHPEKAIRALLEIGGTEDDR
jgi:CRISPR-associated protein (cas_TM1812).